MFQRVTLVLMTILISCVSFVACKQKVEKVQVLDFNVEIDQEAMKKAMTPPPDPQAVPDVQAVPEDAQKPEMGEGHTFGSFGVGDGSELPSKHSFPPTLHDKELLPPVPPEASEAVNGLVSVLQAIADSAKEPTCGEVLNRLLAIERDDSVRAKLERSKIIANYDKATQAAINRAYEERMYDLSIQMSAFVKCRNKPEQEDINRVIKSILSPFDPDQRTAPGVANSAPAAVAPAAPAPAVAEPAPAVADPAPAVDAPAPVVAEPAAK